METIDVEVNEVNEGPKEVKETRGDKEIIVVREDLVHDQIKDRMKEETIRTEERVNSGMVLSS